MRHTFSLLALSLLPVMLAAQSAPGSAPEAVPPQGSSAPVDPNAFYRDAARTPVRVARASEVAAWLKAGQVVLIDVRSPQAYAHGHLRGAVNLPATELTDDALKRIAPAGSRIVIYCDDNFFPTRRIALTTLCYPAFRTLGYKNVFVLQELWNEPSCRVEKALLDGSDPCPRLLPMEKPAAQ